MKPILCPIDFSECADNALHYASALATKLDTPLVVLHVLHVPTVDMYSPASVLSSVMDAQKAAAKNKLEALIERFSEKYSCDYKWQVEFGFATDNIAEQASELNAELVCMGTHGMTNAIEKVLGSVSFDTVKKVTQPVLVVPQEVSLDAIDHVTIAYDEPKQQDFKAEILDEILSSFIYTKAWVHVNKDQKTDLTIITEEQDHTVYELGGDDVAEALANFVKQYGSKMLVLKQHHRGFIEELFHTSVIKKVLERSKVPVLILN